MNKSVIRLGVVQPQGKAGDAAPDMLKDALRFIADGAERGVDLLVFPETYPGPVSWHTRYEVIDPLREAAREHHIDLVAGTTEKAPGDARAYHIVCLVIGRDGEIRGRYRRTHPSGPYYRGLYAEGPFWQFEYVEADELPVFEMDWGTLAVSICSEVFVPEVARALADQGAEVCAFPTGCMIDDLGFTESWQTLVRARAIENTMYTATTMNLFDEALRQAHVSEGLKPVDPATGLNSGHAMIASPEHVLATMRGPGVLSADLDLAYIRRMRAEPEFPHGVTVPPPFISLPGLANLRRPDLTAAETKDIPESDTVPA
jgi:predicted amidohydrolase